MSRWYHLKDPIAWRNISLKNLKNGESGFAVLHLTDHLESNTLKLLFVCLMLWSFQVVKECHLATLKPNRSEKRPFTAQKRLGRGSYKENQDKDKPLFVTSWFDNKRVLVISSFIGEQPLGECEWFDHKLKRTIEVLQLNLYSFTMSTWLELTSLTWC